MDLLESAQPCPTLHAPKPELGMEERAVPEELRLGQHWARAVTLPRSTADKCSHRVWAIVGVTSITLDPLLRADAGPGTIPTSAAHLLCAELRAALPLGSAPCCCHFSIFPSGLICYKHQLRNTGILSTLSEAATV